MNSLNNDFLREANEKFLIGDPIDDQELSALLRFYEGMCRGLAFLDGHFHLAWGECNRRRNTLEDYQRARKSR